MAMPLPIPRPAPVISATLPARGRAGSNGVLVVVASEDETSTAEGAILQSRVGCSFLPLQQDLSQRGEGYGVSGFVKNKNKKKANDAESLPEFHPWPRVLCVIYKAIIRTISCLPPKSPGPASFRSWGKTTGKGRPGAAWERTGQGTRSRNSDAGRLTSRTIGPVSVRPGTGPNAPTLGGGGGGALRSGPVWTVVSESVALAA